MYKVIKYFTDLQDREHAYNVGDTFPREGVTVPQARLEELSGSNNRQHAPLIEEVKPTRKGKNVKRDLPRNKKLV